MTEDMRIAFVKEEKRRLDILGITDYCTIYACFDINEKARSIPFYGNWFHMDRHYSIKDNGSLKRVVKSVEGTYGCQVYAAIYNRYEKLGDMLTLLTISSDESDWEQEREELKEMRPIAYVYNLTYPGFSEWGTVLLRMNENVLERIG